MVVQTEAAKGVQGVLMRLTDGDQADGGVRAAADKSVYAVGAGPGEQRRHALLDHPAFEFGSISRKMHRVIEIDAVRRQCDFGGDERRRGTMAVEACSMVSAVVSLSQTPAKQDIAIRRGPRSKRPERRLGSIPG